MASDVLCKIKGCAAGGVNQLLERVGGFSRTCLFRVISAGPIPNHLAFIMDGNRRYAKKHGLEERSGHKAGFSALMSMLQYCYELGVKYVTIYAFSIDNFKRRPDEVHSLMDLMLEKIESLLEKESIAHEYGIRVYFIGNLKLVSDPVRAAAEKVMKATAKNSRTVLLVCVAYTSLDEIVTAVEKSCTQKLDGHRCSNGINKVKNSEKINNVVVCDCEETYSVSRYTSQELTEKGCGGEWCVDGQIITPAKVGDDTGKNFEGTEMEKHDCRIHLVDIEKNMRMAVAPDPDILIRTSGETRLSNFLLWQTSHCPLYSPAALWPEIGLWHLVWAILNFQRSHSYLEKKKKQP